MIQAGCGVAEAAGQKKGGAGGLKFEAAETAHLQRAGVAATDDSPKFGGGDVTTTLLAILTADGSFPSTTEVPPLPPPRRPPRRA